MAQLFPEDFQASETERRFSGELATLLRLKRELSDQHCVFHGVHWTKVEDEATVYGEIDFLIVNPYGKILAIEQDGLVWKTEYKKEPIAYGVFKLVIGATIEDLKVSTDEI